VFWATHTLIATNVWIPIYLLLSRHKSASIAISSSILSPSHRHLPVLGVMWIPARAFSAISAKMFPLKVRQAKLGRGGYLMKG